MEELTISVIIADRQYRLTINKTEEEVLREAAKLINKTIKEYSDNYAYKDKQDLLAMVALEFTTNSINFEKQISFRDNEMVDKLTEIDKVLSNNLE
ncbi:MAG: cell division protein ZapA [Bacteroidales bacterium]|nr:cell division protein ZapA [Bacteroidales bacterium]